MLFVVVLQGLVEIVVTASAIPICTGCRLYSLVLVVLVSSVEIVMASRESLAASPASTATPIAIASDTIRRRIVWLLYRGGLVLLVISAATTTSITSSATSAVVTTLLLLAVLVIFSSVSSCPSTPTSSIL